LERAPAELEQRIDERVAAMLRSGLIEEVRRLRAVGLERNPSAAAAIGYRETLSLLDGAITADELAPLIIRDTRRLVKKQRTWFRSQLPAHRVLDASGLKDCDELFGPA
jgi:tRNA dimethylallyltransferase